MSLINGALQIGRSAITTSQAALSVTGNNMANAATESYSRQKVHLTPTQVTEVMPGKYTGTGVVLHDIRRQFDEALNGRIRSAVSDSASYDIQQQAMSRVESAFNELTEQDLSSRLNEFFGAWSSLQTQPTDIATRNVVIQTGSSLSSFVRELRSELHSIQEDLDSQVKFYVEEADTLATQIAGLNEQIVTAEAGNSGGAAALRDQRDGMLKSLSEMITITSRETEGGAVNVFVGNEPLIQYAESRGLSYKETLDQNGYVLSQVAFADNNDSAQLSGGKIHGLITARDDMVGDIINDLDTWGTALVFETNKLHSLGRGLDTLTSVSGEYAVDDPTASLASLTDTKLPWEVSNGVFNVHVYDSNGQQSTTKQVKVDIGVGTTDTTITSLAADLDAIDGITAYVDGTNHLRIDSSNAGGSFAFSAPDDYSSATNVLAALGINIFFEGKNAVDIDVKSDLAKDPRAIAAGARGLTGNADIAGKIASLATVGVDSLNGISVFDNFSSLVGYIATETKKVNDNYSAADVVVQTLENERQGISGVSMDEEAMNMITFQRAFQGAARYVSLIDTMMDEVMALVR